MIIRRTRFVVTTLFFLSSVAGTHARAAEPNRTEVKEAAAPSPGISRYLGMNYFVYFNGPGLDPDNFDIPPNQLGRASQNGINFFNLVSFRYKFESGLGLDLQTRFCLIVNNGIVSCTYTPFQLESPRIGISGRLASGEGWSLTGAVNTDFPYFLPSPLTGYTASRRQVLFNPGMFASFKWNPTGSRWSVFSVVAPRFFIYRDRNASEPEFTQGGMSAANKPELTLQLQPTINYSIANRTDLSLGTTIDYRKQVLSSWNPFNASLRTNGSSPAWRLEAVPATIGVAYQVSSALRLFPYVMAYPIAAQRTDARTGRMASLLESASIGMWINGTLL